MISQRDHEAQNALQVCYPRSIADSYGRMLNLLDSQLRPGSQDSTAICVLQPPAFPQSSGRRTAGHSLKRQQERALRVRLLSMELLARLEDSGIPPTPLQLRQMLDSLELRSPDLVCDLLLTRELLLWRLIGDNCGLLCFSRAELSRLLGRLDRLADDQQIWQALALWAFRHRDNALLERAHDCFLRQALSSPERAPWQRVQLMFLLRSGRATRREVLETIRSLITPPQLEDFRRQLLPACIESGVADVSMLRLLDERSAQLQAAGASRPSAAVRNRLRSQGG